MWRYIKYNFKFINILVILFLIGSSNHLFAQELSDFESRTSVGASYPIAKKTDFQFKYTLRMNDNSTTFKRSMFTFQLEHKINKWLKVGGKYRFNTSYNKDFNRFSVYGIVEKSINKKWDISYRKLFQYDITYFDQEYMSEKPSWLVDRNMIKLKYNWNKKTTPYAYVELYSKFKNQEYVPFRLRIGLGASYLYKKRHDFGAEYVINEAYNVINPWNFGFINLKYNYNIPKFNKQPKIKKGKKKHNQ